MKQLVKWSVLFLLIFPFSDLSAQGYFYNDKYYDDPLLIELGASIGLMNCLTDLGKPNSKKFIKDVSWKDNRRYGGVYATLLYNNCIGVRLEANIGKLTAQDAIPRNLYFSTTITEILLMGEFHFLYSLAPRFSPYLLAGIGIFKFNPQPLRAEGYYYKLTQINFPLGGGIKYEISPLFNIRFEGIYRILMTDYLDDVSKRGNPKKKDTYFSGGIKIGMVINRTKR